MPEERLYKSWEMPSATPAPKKAGRPKPTLYSEKYVYDRLQFAFPSPTFVLLPQVRNATGFSDNSKYRTVDALAASVFPSRGLYLAGIEIKVTKTDWRKELRDPEKSGAIMKYCKYWYMACPVGIIPVGELPEAWGLVEVRADGATIVKRAEAMEAEPPSLGFLCSVLRAASHVANTSLEEESDVSEDCGQ